MIDDPGPTVFSERRFFVLRLGDASSSCLVDGIGTIKVLHYTRSVYSLGIHKSLPSLGHIITLTMTVPTGLVSETQLTLYEPSINGPEATDTELERRIDTFGPGSLETLAPVNEPVEGKPVSWDGPNDPNNPQNWSPSKKWLVMAVNGIITINVYVRFVCPRCC